MPSVSKAQQRFMGMVHALQKGEIKPSKVSGKVKKAAKSMKKKDADDFASTKHKGLPNKVKKEELYRLIAKYGAKKVRESIFAVKGKEDHQGYRHAEKPNFKYDEGFGGQLKGSDRKKFEKARKENAEVLGYKLTGTKDIKESSSAYGKSIEKIANNKKLKSISKKDRDTLMKIAKLMKKSNESVNEAGLEMNKLKDAIKMFQKKIKKQGRVTNARDEERLKNLIKVYKQMGGKGVKESVNEAKSFKPEKRRKLKSGEIEVMKGRGSKQKWFYVKNGDDVKTLVRLGRNYGFPTGIAKNNSKLKFNKSLHLKVKESVNEKMDKEQFHDYMQYVLKTQFKTPEEKKMKKSIIKKLNIANKKKGLRLFKEISGIQLAKKVVKNKQHEKGMDLFTAQYIVQTYDAYKKHPELRKKIEKLSVPKAVKLANLVMKGR